MPGRSQIATNFTHGSRFSVANPTRPSSDPNLGFVTTTAGRLTIRPANTITIDARALALPTLRLSDLSASDSKAFPTTTEFDARLMPGRYHLATNVTNGFQFSDNNDWLSTVD